MVRSRLAEQVGRVVGGRYRLLAPVGTGASADVYVADDVTLRRRVAVKLLHDALAADEGFLRRFRAEARTAAALRHSNIMTVFDWGEEGDGPFLVLEYLGGGSLRDLLDRGHRLSVSQATLVGLEAARGLDHAHRRGLVHRDIKPANLLFDDEGRLAIADFGIARALAEATWTEPAGAVVGTARYASPEQVRGNSLDGRADVYALALVLEEAVTGAVPFSADTTIATLMARLDRPIPVPDAMGALGRVIAAAGAIDPADRVDAAGMVRALEAAAETLPRPMALPLSPIAQLPLVVGTPGDQTTTFAPIPVPAIDPTLAQPATVATSAVPSPPPPAPPIASPPQPRRPRRWRYPWIAVAVILVALIVAAAVLARGALNPPTYLVPPLVGSNISSVSAPAHFRLVEHHVRLEGKPKGTIVGQSPATGMRPAGTLTLDVSDGRPLVAVPNLGGMSVDEARGALQAVQLTLNSNPLQAFSDTVAVNHVVSWTAEGTSLEEGLAVTITISGGPRFVPMPTVAGLTYEQAVAAVEAAGIAAPGRVDAFSDSVPKDTVISSIPAGNSSADRTAAPTLTVSKGPDVVKVPHITGLSVADAEAALVQAGLNPVGPYGPPGAGIVVDSQPAEGRKVKRGASVVLYTGYF